MTLSLAAFGTLKKLMARTTSDNDHEALSSLRAANKILAGAGVTWEMALNRVIRVEVPFESDADDALPALFEAALERSRGEFHGVIESIHEQWERNGFISPRQREVVERAAHGR